MSEQTPTIPLPNGWRKQVRCAVLHVISLAQYAAAYTRGWAADSTNARVRLKAEWDRADQELLLLREEIRIKDARLARIDPHRRPHFPPTERMAILQLKATRAWSLEQTARVFQLTAATVASWVKRVDEQGPDALVQLREPVGVDTSHEHDQSYLPLTPWSPVAYRLPPVACRLPPVANGLPIGPDMPIETP